MKLQLLLIASLAALPAQAQLYKWTDAEGKVHVTDRVPKGVTPEKVIEAPPVAAASQPASGQPAPWQKQEQDFQARKEREDTVAQDRVDVAAQNKFTRRFTQSNDDTLELAPPMTSQEVCDNARRELEFFERAKDLQIINGHSAPADVSEAERQRLIGEARNTSTYACAVQR